MRLGAKARMEMLFDDSGYETIEVAKPLADPLKFRDLKKYSDRLKEAQAKTKNADAILVAHGRVGGVETVMAALDFAFMGGSMGIAVGDGIIAAARRAIKLRAPLVVLTS